MKRSTSPNAGPRPKVTMEQDHFSDLPDDCLISIFSRLLESDDLDELHVVSERIHRIATHPSAQPAERPRALLWVTRLQPASPHAVAGYKVKSSSDSVNEIRHLSGVNDAGFIGSRNSEFGERNLNSSLSIYLDRISISHKVETAVFLEVILTNDFISKMIPALRSVGVLRIKVSEIHQNFGMKRLEDFILATKSRNVMIHFASTDQNQAKLRRKESIFDHEFLLKFISTSPDKYYRLKAIDWARRPWAACVETLPLICRFNGLHLTALIMEPQLLVELILMRLEKEEVYAFWEFCVKSPIDAVHLSRIDRNKFSVTSTSIKKKNSQFQALYNLHGDPNDPVRNSRKKTNSADNWILDYSIGRRLISITFAIN